MQYLYTFPYPTSHPQIRKQAIKDLPTLCKGKTELVPKVADILAQLQQVEDPVELSTVQGSLVTLLKTDPKGRNAGASCMFQMKYQKFILLLQGINL